MPGLARVALQRCLLAAVPGLLPAIAAAAAAATAGRTEGVPPPQGQRLVLESGAVDLADVAALQELLKRGSTAACCGRWRGRAAAQLQRSVASALGVSERRLSDVKMANATTRVWAGALSSHWGPVAVLYLDDSPDATVSFEGESGEGLVVDAPRGTVLVTPEGDQLVHRAARSVAWLHLRREGAPDRSAFEFFVASGIRSTFVTPHDTAPQRKFFRSHTRNPTYWHGFFWGFLGLFCTILACLPLAWWGIQFVEQWLAGVPAGAAAAATQRRGGPRARPEADEQLPTLLPLVRSGEHNHAGKWS